MLKATCPASRLLLSRQAVGHSVCFRINKPPSQPIPWFLPFCRSYTTKKGPAPHEFTLQDLTPPKSSKVQASKGSILDILGKSQRKTKNSKNSRKEAKLDELRARLMDVVPSKSMPRLNKKTREEETAIDKMIERFPRRRVAKKKALELGIDAKEFQALAQKFTKMALARNVSITRDNMQQLIQANRDEGYEGVYRTLQSAFYEFAEPSMPASVKQQFTDLRKLSDLRFPSEWFPEARQMQRKIYLHVGPTNSGKTYHAIQRLQKAASGIYCGPLRLLAHEIYEKMNAQGIACNLLTGEERREVSATAPLTSSTVEMANLAKPLEVAVIDEIQLIADSQRGWAWTQALLGLKAKEIHLCGEASAVPLVKGICETLGDQVIVNEYQRLTPVSASYMSLDGDLTRVESGDAVVAFSRKDIFSLKQDIEKETGLQCAVAYGALPPEIRALQAKKFNDPNDPACVLVASDAIGMGLNLNIRRVIFSRTAKFDGKHFSSVPVPQIKQIAGRAGRFGTAFESGEVTTLYPKDLSFLHDCLEAPIENLKLAGLQPTVDIFEVFALQMPNEKYSTILQKFEDLASVDGHYFLCNFTDQKIVADAIEDIRLPIRDRYVFVTAPVSTRNEMSLDVMQTFARAHSDGQDLDLADIVQLPIDASNPDSLPMLENTHKMIMLYMWLGLRFPLTFSTPQEDCLAMKHDCELLIDQLLHNSRTPRAKNKKKQRQQRVNAKSAP